MASTDNDQQNLKTSTIVESFYGALVGGNFDGFVEFVAGLGISRLVFLGALYFGLMAVLWRMIPNLPLLAFGWLIGTAPVWFPILCIFAGSSWWLWYVRSYHQTQQKTILLEVKMPNTIIKSPRAMEMVFSAFRQLGGSTNTFINRVWVGGVAPAFSFEIVSFAGSIHFYVFTWEKYRRTVEEAFYAHYPEVEIVEAEDYAAKFKFDPEKYQVHCFDWRLEPRSDAYPFKTYIDFELEQDPKEEYKIDPFAQVMETMSTMKPNEQAWVQIIITKNPDEAPGDRWYKTQKRHKLLVKRAVDEIRKATVTGSDKDLTGDEKEKNNWRGTAARLEQFQVGELLRSIERNAGKINYAVGMRGTYIASPPESYSGTSKDNFRLMWRQIGNEAHGNHLRHRRWHPAFDYPWQDLWDMRVNLSSKRFYDVYRRRAHFDPPWILPHNIMSVEMLATIWHPPSQAVEARGLERIASKKKSAPHNLPT